MHMPVKLIQNLKKKIIFKSHDAFYSVTRAIRQFGASKGMGASTDYPDYPSLFIKKRWKSSQKPLAVDIWVFP